MSELARRSGVPAATIKHYLREGLLPEPRARTGRTMAYYDPAVVERIKAIKELQQKRFLPLKVIAEVLDGADPYRSEETAAALETALQEPVTGEVRTRAELVAGGMPSAQLDFFCAIGLVEPDGDGEEQRFSGDDLAILRTLGAARRQGISPEMLPHTIVATYIGALQELVRVELLMFREGLARAPEGDVAKLVPAASRLSEQLVVLLRRNMLLPTLRQLMTEASEPATKSPRNKSKRRKPKQAGDKTAAQSTTRRRRRKP